MREGRCKPVLYSTQEKCDSLDPDNFRYKITSREIAA